MIKLCRLIFQRCSLDVPSAVMMSDVIGLERNFVEAIFFYTSFRVPSLTSSTAYNKEKRAERKRVQ